MDTSSYTVEWSDDARCLSPLITVNVRPATRSVSVHSGCTPDPDRVMSIVLGIKILKTFVLQFRSVIIYYILVCHKVRDVDRHVFQFFCRDNTSHLYL